MAKIEEYIAERYPEYEPRMATYLYTTHLLNEGCKMLSKPFGFITYKFEGDACIIFDIYTNKEYRKTKKAWSLWAEMLEIIQQNTNCHVVIGFSEFGGTNHQDGIGAMIAAGFKKAYDLEDRTVYIRGTQ